MAELIDLSELQEKVILVAVSTAEEEDTPASLDELEELASTAGAVTVARIIQNRERVHPGTYLGKGKIDEVRELLWDTRATGVICDDELSPAQLRNLEDALDTKVMDRTMVILDIFASRASTREGKIQVELAQLKYRAVRLAGILAEDKLFATLDPTTRSYTLEDGQQILLTDTVGFIRKLPHHLIEAFKSTLEEARYSDIVLHVVDCSNPQMDMQMHVVKETLEELEIVDKTIVTVFNKVDRFYELEAMEDNRVMQIPRDFSSDYQVRISARTGEGLEELQKVLQAIIRSRRILLEKVFPYSQAGRIQTIRKYGQLLEEEYQEDGIAVKAYVPAELFGKLYSD